MGMDYIGDNRTTYITITTSDITYSTQLGSGWQTCESVQSCPAPSASFLHSWRGERSCNSIQFDSRVDDR